MLSDGSPANPPEFSTTELNWRQGDVIPLGRERSLPGSPRPASATTTAGPARRYLVDLEDAAEFGPDRH